MSDFEEMFDGMDPEKIEMDVAFESMVSLYKGLRKQGLPRTDAAIMVAAMIKTGEDNGQN